MSCYHPNVMLMPLQSWLKPDGSRYDDDYQAKPYFAGSLQDWMIDSIIKQEPVVVNNRKGIPVMVPCGNCVACRLEYSKDWANRMLLEAQYHERNSFITLTYDEQHVPITEYTNDEGVTDLSMTLVHADFTSFMKRLRRRLEYDFDVHIRFYACGEYGSHTFRPHYHAIIFGWDFPDRNVYQQTVSGKLCTSRLLQECWSYGFTTVSDMSWETCAYVARYCMKKVGRDMKEFYDTFALEPEFVVMSRMPGIGFQWYEDHKQDNFYKYDAIDLATPKKGYHFRPPRYYDRKYDIDYPEQMSLIKDNRCKQARMLLDLRERTSQLSYLECLAIQERQKTSQVKSLKRRFDNET